MSFTLLNHVSESYCVKDEDGISTTTLAKELLRHQPIEKQAGYSQSRQCDYISIVLVYYTTGDGEFLGYSATSTCLLKFKENIIDKNDYSDMHGEVGFYIKAIYHQLPDGNIVEYLLHDKSYTSEISNIYQTIENLRFHSYLQLNLPKNEITTQPKL